MLFGVIAQLVEDDAGNIYLLDGQLSEIQVFSRQGEWLRTIGREGEGPGEFRNGSDLSRGPDGNLGVVQIFPGRIVKLTLEGDPAGNFPLPKVEGGGFQAIHLRRDLVEPLQGVPLKVAELREAFPRARESRVAFGTAAQDEAGNPTESTE